MVAKVLIDWHHAAKIRSRVRACLFIRQARPIVGRCRLETPLRGPAQEGEGSQVLIQGDGFRPIAGKVKTCFSRAFSQANPTAEKHGA
jgi:hypothetical protein